jgi:proline dehydrogenase
MRRFISRSSRRLLSSSRSLAKRENALQDKSIAELITVGSFYHACGSSRIVSVSKSLLQMDNVFGTALRQIIRSSVFKLFCGGETLSDCVHTARHLHSTYNVRSIVDHAIEEAETEEQWNDNLREKVAILQQIASALGDEVKQIPIKCTSLIDPKLLESITHHYVSLADNPDFAKDFALDERLLAMLTVPEMQSFTSGYKRLEQICRVAKDANISLLFDAEQTYRQPAVEVIVRRLSKQFNALGSVPVVYNTYQMYLTRSPGVIRRDLRAAYAGGYAFAAKIVRGAYMVSEREYARDKGLLDPILPSKACTDAAYDAIISELLQLIAARGTGDMNVTTRQFERAADVHILIASHNSASITRAAEAMEALGICRSDTRVYFAQILGMSDHNTTALGLRGYNAAKLVPFGEFEELLPWLLRRLDENQDALGAMQTDRKVFRDELMRRMTRANVL